MKYIFPLCLFLLTILNSCKKTDTSQNAGQPCSTLTSVKATPNTLNVNQGEKFTYSCSPVFSGSTTSTVTYTWTIPGETVRTYASDSIASIDYRHAGWWYITAKNTCDGVVKKDSFQLAVTPSCNNAVTNNIFNFTGFLTGTATFTGTNQQNGALNYNASETYFGIQANQPSATGSIVLVFHPQFNLANLPPTGLYSTSIVAANGHPVFGSGDNNKCFINYVVYNITAGIVIYKSDPNQYIYITNENGKLKAVLCGIGLTGTSSLTGLTYHPVATGALAVP